MRESFGKAGGPYEMKLVPIRPRGVYKSEINHKFERLNNLKQRESDLPILRFNTPAWISGIVAPFERDTMEKNPVIFETNFKERMKKQEEQELMELILPKPPKKAKHCGVCDLIYEDYYLHIYSDEHQNNLKQNDFISTICLEAQAIQEEFQNNILKEFDFNDLQSNNKSLISENIQSDQQKIENGENPPTRIIRHIRDADKENNQPQIEGSDSKKKNTVRRIFYEDYEAPQLSERGVPVEKVFNFQSQGERSPWREEKKTPVSVNKSPGGFISYNRGEQEEEQNSHNRVFYGHGQSPSRNSILSSQHSTRNSQYIYAMQVSTDVEPRESGVRRPRNSLKRKNIEPTESEVLSSLKKVKITDESTSQEDTSPAIHIKLVKGRLSNLASSVSGLIGSFANSISRLWDLSLTKQTNN